VVAALDASAGFVRQPRTKAGASLVLIETAAADEGQASRVLATPLAEFAQSDTASLRLWRQPGGLARTLGVGKGLDADYPPIAESQER
jgi:hypothetical protein